MNHPQTHAVKPKRKIWAFLLSLLSPGLGHLYCGKLVHALVFFCVDFTLPIAFGLMRWSCSPVGLLAVLLCLAFLRIFVAILSLKHCISNEYNEENQRTDKLLSYSFAVFMLAAPFVFGFQTRLGIWLMVSATPTSSPSIEVGQWFIADPYAFAKQEPSYGDLVVFTNKEGQRFFFRVVAKGGDSISILDKDLIVNGVLCNKEQKAERSINGKSKVEFLETASNGAKYPVLHDKTVSINPNPANGSFVVSENHYFVLGDNRDESLDSRFIGEIHKDQVLAKVLGLLF